MSKDDLGKTRYDLIPATPIELLAKVYTFGAEKYYPRSWEEGMDWSRVFAATMRHLWAFWGGENIDPESGLPHISHAAWGCFALMEYMNTHKKGDDRPNVDSASVINEIEAKFRLGNTSDTVASIKKKATFSGHERQRDIYLIHESIDGYRNKEVYTRIRDVNGSINLTIHTKNQDYDWNELSMAMENGESAFRLLEALGFKKDVIVEKSRDIYKYGETLLMIDEVEGLGSFLEIEAPDTTILSETAKEFGYQIGGKDDLSEMSYADLTRNRNEV